PANASANLFVGNLSWNIDEEWLAREFEPFGEIVGCRIITDRDSGRSKGFGYVEFANAEDAAKALKEKKGSHLDGRELNVDFSQPKSDTPKERGNQRASKFGDSRSEPSSTLFIGNISFDATPDMLSETFSTYGTINRVSLPTDINSGAPKGFGYVEFSSIEEATAAIEGAAGTTIAGRPLRLDF
ncbi:hypothetical protein M501DRAFT_908351, partial [Patellaria atrata CBS 101060]